MYHIFKNSEATPIKFWENVADIMLRVPRKLIKLFIWWFEQYLLKRLLLVI